MQNRAARTITKLGWFTPIKTLLEQCNWLSIKQLIFYHTALQVWKVKASECPVYINNKFKPSNTRSSNQGTLLVPAVEKATSSKSFIVRSASTWNHLPQDIRNIKNLSTFKVNLKAWTKENISIEWTSSRLQTTLLLLQLPKFFTGPSRFSSKKHGSIRITIVNLNLILKRKCSHLIC